MTDDGVSPIPREARPYQGRRAGLVSRFAGSAIDALVVLLLVVVTYGALAGTAFLLDPRGFSFPAVSRLWNLTFVLLLLTAYLAVAWWLPGRTYGGQVMGLRVVDRRGRRLGPAVALARAVFCVVFPVGLLWCALDRRNRSLQDVLLRTAVVYDWQPGAVRPGQPLTPMG